MGQLVQIRVFAEGIHHIWVNPDDVAHIGVSGSGVPEIVINIRTSHIGPSEWPEHQFRVYRCFGYDTTDDLARLLGIKVGRIPAELKEAAQMEYARFHPHANSLPQEAYYLRAEVEARRSSSEEPVTIPVTDSNGYDEKAPDHN